MDRRSTSVEDDPSHIQLITDPRQIADKEAQNGLRQFDEVLRIIREENWDFKLTPAVIKRLQWFAIDGLWSSAGQFRCRPVVIRHSNHKPPHFDHVPALVEKMCDYANDHMDEPIHVSAYLMWRLNWIHPFGDGNGRTSRALSYLALSIGYKMELPGAPTIPDLIVRDKNLYYAAIDAADSAWESRVLDVKEMEHLIKKLLSEQLLSVSSG